MLSPKFPIRFNFSMKCFENKPQSGAKCKKPYSESYEVFLF